MTGRTAATWLSRAEIGVSGVFLRSRGRRPATRPYPDGTLQGGISQMPLVAKSGSAFLWVGESLIVRLCLFLTLSGESSHRTPQRASSRAFPHEWRTCLGNRTKVGRCKPESIFFLHLFRLYFELFMFRFSHVRSLAEILIAADSEWNHRSEWSWTHRSPRPTSCFLGDWIQTLLG